MKVKNSVIINMNIEQFDYIIQSVIKKFRESEQIDKICSFVKLSNALQVILQISLKNITVLRNKRLIFYFFL